MPLDWDSATLRPATQDVQFPSDTLPLAGTTVTFPGPHQVGRKHNSAIKVVGIGDTGCRHSRNRTSDNPNFWQVAKSAVTANPDLVFQIGDYRYLDVNRSNSQIWAHFKTEWFDPARKLLANAPLIAGRGNHEQCTTKPHDVWYGDGLFWLFEAADANQSSCRNPARLERRCGTQEISGETRGPRRTFRRCRYVAGL